MGEPVWPITLAEAARRLDIPASSLSVILHTHGVPSLVVGRCRIIEEPAFEQLRALKARLPGSSHRNRRKATCPA
jgi:hypothetical protein